MKSWKSSLSFNCIIYEQEIELHNNNTACSCQLELVQKMPHKQTCTGPLEKVLFELKSMKCVEFCKFCLSHPGKLKAKVDLDVSHLFLCGIFGTSSNWHGHPVVDT